MRISRWLCLQARPRLNGMIVGVPLRLEGDVPLTLLASLTGLLPGMVALGFSPDRRVIYVHAAGMPDAQAARASVQSVERRLLAITDA
nr:Na+/H+ antiporter subunit E [Deinococcus sp. S9]